MHDEIEKHDPDAMCHAKVFNHRAFTGSIGLWGNPISAPPARHDGIDREALMELLEINGCDTRILAQTPYNVHHPWQDMDDYAIQWFEQSIAFDFMRSLQPDKLIYDSEWHSIQTLANRDADMPDERIQAALWLAHLHGMGANVMWYWARKWNSSPSPSWESSFYGSLSTLPGTLNSYVRTMLEINRAGGDVKNLASQQRPVRILYSNASAIQSSEFCDALVLIYESLYFQDLPIGFVTEKMLQEGWDNQDLGFIIVPNAGYVDDQTVSALRNYILSGGRAAFAGEKCFKYNKRGFVRSESSLSFIQNCPQFDLKPAKELMPEIQQALANADIQPLVECEDWLKRGGWGVLCRSYQNDSDSYTAALVNTGAEKTVVSLNQAGGFSSAENILTGRSVNPELIYLAPLEQLLIRLHK
ncbi:hypothetical protein L21SP3_00918 [Sedimentisphaera cyanobacteriorum]|uniref:Beta-galactosidase n=1 Tax=Sedimentisphaera cyanobacteriorum TaxID=1940790 RepID=A0A1Q2HNS5_9BACT|nr:hypothetical protein L21SP3_00918 [Sedimentisphaera cyanobacteriorum]